MTRSMSLRHPNADALHSRLRPVWAMGLEPDAQSEAAGLCPHFALCNTLTEGECGHVRLVTLTLVLVYFGVGIALTERAQKHLRDPNKDFWFTPMYEPEKFTPLGNALRVRALRFWFWGGIALAVYLAVL